MGLYNTENIDNPNICTFIVNPKEYLGKLKNRSIHKKHTWVSQDMPGMNFESYAERIKDPKEIGSKKNKKKNKFKNDCKLKIQKWKWRL